MNIKAMRKAVGKVDQQLGMSIDCLKKGRYKADRVVFTIKEYGELVDCIDQAHIKINTVSNILRGEKVCDYQKKI